MKNIDDTFAELRKKSYSTTKELNDLGINSNDINKLITKGYIKRICKGYYKIMVSGNDYDSKKSKLRQAKIAYNNKQYNKALKLVTNYVHFNKSNKAHYLLYEIYLKLEDFEKAFKELQISYELNSADNIELYTTQLLLLKNILYKEKEKLSLIEDIKTLAKYYFKTNKFEELNTLSKIIDDKTIKEHILTLNKPATNKKNYKIL